MSDWTDPLMSFSTHLEIFSPEGEPLLGAPLLSSLAYDAGLFDFKGRPLQPMLDVGNLPPEGSFSVFNISLEKAVSTSRGTESLPEGPAPVLVYFLPVPETRNVISVALLLSDITAGGILFRTGDRPQHAGEVQYPESVPQRFHFSL